MIDSTSWTGLDPRRMPFAVWLYGLTHRWPCWRWNYYRSTVHLTLFPAINATAEALQDHLQNRLF